MRFGEIMPKDKKDNSSSIAKASVSRIPTCIPGFDKLIQGGFVKGSINLVSGGPGSGKTIFALQYIYNGVKDFDENGLFMSFEENVSTLKEDAALFGWDFDKLERDGSCTFFSMQPFTNPDLRSNIVAVVKKKGIKRVVIDSISIFSMALKDDSYRIRKEFYSLTDLLRGLGCTIVVTAEIPGEPALDIAAGGASLSRDGIIEFVADSVVTLHNSGLGGETDRAIRVLKMRRTNHEKAPTPMKITDDGMVVL
jgi:circadian clock protein KaiC